MNALRKAAHLLAVPAAAGVVLLSVAGPASAHVTITPNTTAAGAHAVLTLSIGHGCEGSATTKVAIQIPDEILSVTPTRHPLWTVTEQQEKLAEPVTDGHGNEVTERDAVVLYTATTPLPYDHRDTLELSLKLPRTKARRWRSLCSRAASRVRTPGPRWPKVLWARRSWSSRPRR